MSERVWPAVRVRPVRGRVVDPFRGTPTDEDPERFAARSVDKQPLDDVIAVFDRLRDIRVVRAGRRFTFGRGHEVAKVAFASAARSVSLEDAMFEGDGALLLVVLHALLPLFGAVEITIGKHRELIDGHEPLDAIVKRYESWWIDESLKLAKRMQKPPPPTQPAPPMVKSNETRSAKYAAIFVMLLLAILITAIWRAGQ